VIGEGESEPSESAKKSMALFFSQLKEIAKSNPAKRTLNKEQHEEKMKINAAKGDPTFPFRGDKYSIDGLVTTPSGDRKVVRTGWQMRDIDGTEEKAPVLLSAYLK
jgi:hypothetical protein